MFGAQENGKRTVYFLDVQFDYWSLDIETKGTLPTKLTEEPIANASPTIAYDPNGRSPAVFIGRKQGKGIEKLYLSGAPDRRFEAKLPEAAGDCYSLYADGNVVFGIFDNVGGNGGNLLCAFDVANGTRLKITGTHGGPYSDGLSIKSSFITGKLYHVPGAGHIPSICLSGTDGIYTYTYSGGAPITGAVDLSQTGHVATASVAPAILAGPLNRNEPGFVYGTTPGNFFKAAADGSGAPSNVAIEGLPCSNQKPVQIVESENRFYILMAEDPSTCGVVAVFDKDMTQDPAHFIPGGEQPNALVWLSNS